MTREEILAYVRRDWRAVEAAKLAGWARRKQEMTPDQALALAGSLRESVRRRRPEWPRAAERDEDLGFHTELSRRLRLVESRSRG